MKKLLKSIFMLALVMCLLTYEVAYANMAAPAEADIGSAVSFEKNEEIAVFSETLDITVEGAEANIRATYKMKNTTDESVATKAMFLSPNIKSSGVAVLIGGKSVGYTSASYALNYSTEVATDNWQYIVLVDEQVASRNDDKTVDTISFQMDFAPNEEYDVAVSYRYRLGGYPNYDFDARRGDIEYYLAPAAMWKNFSSLTINLYLDENMPIIKSSNLEFKKTGKRTYQYTSDTLPKENLKVTLDENWWQNIQSTLKSPYLSMWVKIFLPIILIVFAVAILIVWHSRKKKG